MGNGLSDQTSILSSLPSFQSFHIVILGLDCAGKTTVLYRLQFNEFVNTVPTKGFNTEKIKGYYRNSLLSEALSLEEPKIIYLTHS
uniref:ADP ribosylation factor like GTPase 4A n=1 Tax=Aotus nancymaae TaxID=37293 RepID=A0A2K5E2E1_AOTNA